MSEETDVDLDEFIDTSEAVIERLVAKLDADPALGRYAESIRANTGAGEWQLAMEDLVALLHQNRIPVTAADSRDLTAVFTYLTASASEEVSSRARTALDTDVTKLTIA